MAERHTNTVDEWLDRFNDLEAYLATGRSLLDLPVSALDVVPPAMAYSIIKRMGRERLDHHVRSPEQSKSSQRADATGQPCAAQPAPATPDDTRHELH